MCNFSFVSTDILMLGSILTITSNINLHVWLGIAMWKINEHACLGSIKLVGHIWSWMNMFSQYNTRRGSSLEFIALASGYDHVDKTCFVRHSIIIFPQVNATTCMVNKLLIPVKKKPLTLRDAYMLHQTRYHWFRYWLVTWSAPSHYLNQSRNNC